MRAVAALLLALAACGGTSPAVIVAQEAPDAQDETMPPAPDAAPAEAAPARDAAPDAPAPPADAAPDAPDRPDSSPAEAGPAPDAGEDAPDDVVTVDSPPPTYTATCTPSTPWQSVCVIGGVAYNGHRWYCTTNGGDLATEDDPNQNLDLAGCQYVSGGPTADGGSGGLFCCP